MRTGNEYFIKAKRLIPNKAVLVFTRASDGKITGEYDGYWKPELGIVVLYPSKSSWIYGKLLKHSVCDTQVRRLIS